MTSAAARRAALHRLIESERIESQKQAAALLAEAGFRVTQATVSRDLSVMGAEKVADESGSAYRLGDPKAVALGSTIDRFVMDVVPAGNLVVVKTPPAAAHFVASELDHSGIPEIAGTVAGDDTLLVVAADGYTGKELARLIVRGEP